MCKERLIFRIAGSLVLAGLLLGYYVAPGWYLLSAFVGLNMLQASFSGFCPLTKILNRFKVPPCSSNSPTA